MKKYGLIITTIISSILMGNLATADTVSPITISEGENIKYQSESQGNILVINEDGTVGVGTDSPEYALDVDGGYSAGGVGAYSKTYGVSGGEYEDVHWKSGVAELNTQYVYKLWAVTRGTGTDTGSYYIVYYHEGSGEWRSRMVSHAKRDHNSNYPDISIDDSKIQVSHKHGSKYYIHVTVQHLWVRESDAVPTVFGSDFMWVRNNGDLYYTEGKVGIGTDSPQHKLHVDGTIYAQEFSSEWNEWADKVFESDYQLRPLGELQQFIADHKHLPELPSEEEVLSKGIGLNDLQVKLLTKIEENVLYILQLEQANRNLEERLNALESRLSTVESGQ